MTSFASNANPPHQQCTPIGGIQVRQHTLSQSGTTYTLLGSTRYCNGVNAVNRIVVTVRATSISFLHTYSENGVLVERGSGTIPRLA